MSMAEIGHVHYVDKFAYSMWLNRLIVKSLCHPNFPFSIPLVIFLGLPECKYSGASFLGLRVLFLENAH